MSLFNWPLLVTAILLGMGLGIQAPINAWIGKRLGSPYWGAGFSISISCAWAEDGDGPVFHLCCFWSGVHFLVD